MDFGCLLTDQIMRAAVVKKNSMFDFLSVLKTRQRYVNFGRLLAVLCNILGIWAAVQWLVISRVALRDRCVLAPSAQVVFVNSMFLMFFCFAAFSRLRRVHGV